MTAREPAAVRRTETLAWSWIAVIATVVNGAIGGFAAYWLFFFVQWPVDATEGLPRATHGWLIAALPRACFAGAVGLAVVIVLSGVNSLLERFCSQLGRYTSRIRIAITIAMLAAIAFGVAEFVIRKPILQGVG